MVKRGGQAQFLYQKKTSGNQRPFNNQDAGDNEEEEVRPEIKRKKEKEKEVRDY